MKYTIDNLGPIVATSNSVSEVMRKFGLYGNSHKFMTETIDKLGLDRSHFVMKYDGIPGEKKPWTAKLVLGKSLDSKHLRQALLESGREYVCALCPVSGIWNGKPLTLQVDHENGVRSDNRPENLRFLCPNCHTQTETFGKMKSASGKRCSCGVRSKVGRCLKCATQERSKGIPPLEVLRDLIWQYPATEIAKTYDVSDKAVKKWCIRYGLVTPGQGYWTKVRSKMKTPEKSGVL